MLVPATEEGTTMTFDKQALGYAAFLAVEQVLDPEASNDEIVQEVEVERR